MNNLNSIKSQLENMLQTGLSYGCENVSAEEIYHISASIKDIAEASYYCTVTEAMNEKESYEPYGYNRSARTGRFIRGYDKPLEYTYVDGYIHDPYFNENVRMGYSGPDLSKITSPINDGASEDTTRNYNRHGQAYGDWSIARRHYQETKKPEDKEKMDKHALEHVNESVTTLQELWDHADVEQRKRMKMAVDNLHHAMMND